jgi:[ribosomal protein S18]-alanine N-acetyltransferase
VLRVEPPTGDDAAAISTWRYSGPWSVYDSTDEDLAPLSDFVAVRDVAADGTTSLLGFACFDAEARVPGVDADPRILDLGWGMRPDAVGQGRGAEFVSAVLAFAQQARPAVPELRVVVQAWNQRGQRVVERAGFAATRTFVVAQDGHEVEYTELRRPWPIDSLDHHAH